MSRELPSAKDGVWNSKRKKKRMMRIVKLLYFAEDYGWTFHASGSHLPKISRGKRVSRGVCVPLPAAVYYEKKMWHYVYTRVNLFRNRSAIFFENEANSETLQSSREPQRVADEALFRQTDISGHFISNHLRITVHFHLLFWPLTNNNNMS